MELKDNKVELNKAETKQYLKYFWDWVISGKQKDIDKLIKRCADDGNNFKLTIIPKYYEPITIGNLPLNKEEQKDVVMGSYGL